MRRSAPRSTKLWPIAEGAIKALFHPKTIGEIP